METALIYARYSPRPVEEGDAERILAAEDHRSLMLQIETCEAYASVKNFQVVRIIKDPETSARKTKLHEREGGQELLTCLKNGIRHIIIAKLDRMFRHIDGRLQMDEWAERGITLHVANQDGQSIDCSRAMGRLFAGVCLLFAEYEPAITAERTSDQMQRLQRAGKAMSKRPPYGKKIVDGWLIEEPMETEILRMMLSMRRAGMGAKRIAKNFNGNGIDCRGGRWGHKTIDRIILRHERELSLPSSASALSPSQLRTA